MRINGLLYCLAVVLVVCGCAKRNCVLVEHGTPEKKLGLGARRENRERLGSNGRFLRYRQEGPCQIAWQQEHVHCVCVCVCVLISAPVTLCVAT